MARAGKDHVVVIEGPNADSAEYWSSASGLSWIENEAVMDQLLAPVTSKVIEIAGLSPNAHVVDIGCGTGAHSIAAAEQLGDDGSVLAIDISLPFVERTRQRAEDRGLSVKARHCDAQTEPFAAEFDLATSRFGVMFFENPAAAFANIARALRPGGRMVFAAWAPVAVNPWWRLPMAVAGARLGKPPPTPPNAPGPMGLSDRTYAEEQLRLAGLQQATVNEVPVTLSHPGGAAAMAALSLRVGPAARVVSFFDGAESDVRTIEETLSDAYSDYEDADGFAMPAMLNMIDVTVP